jgi:PAS domain S-box-containing protein
MIGLWSASAGSLLELDREPPENIDPLAHLSTFDAPPPQPRPSYSRAKSIEALFELSLDPMCVAGVDGYFKVINPAFSRVLGYDQATLLSTPFVELIHELDRVRTLAEVARLETAGSTVDFENRYLRADGSYVWLQWTARSLGMDEMYCVAREITGQRRLHSLLEDTQQTANIGGWELEFSTEELYWTEQTYRLHEVDPDEFVPTLERAVSFYTPGCLPLISAAVEKARTDGTPWDMELEIITAKGNRRFVRAVGQASFMGAEPVRVYGSFQDITERKQLEEQLLHSQKLDGIGRLAGGVAHDFNNLLTVIVGNTELLQMLPCIDEKAREHIDAVRLAAEQACHVTGQLLAFARKQIREPRYFHPGERLLELTGMLDRLLGEGVHLKCDIEGSTRSILMDPGHFELVLVNLAVNASEAMGAHGELHIEVKDIDGRGVVGLANLEGELVEVVVRDNGEGIPAECLPHLFEPFFTTKESGTGLGLATCHGIVEQNGGTIRAESVPGEWTAFHLYFPAAGESLASERPPAESASESRAGRGKTILLVEDELLVRRITEQTLESFGYMVLSAEDGPSALALASSYEGSVDGLISDVVLPGMGGREIAVAVRELLGPLPVLFVSGYPGDRIDESGIRADGTLFLQKPFTASSLAKQVKLMFEEELLPGESS